MSLQRKTSLRGSSKPRRSPLGHCTPEQKERVANQVCIVCEGHFNECQPAHVVPRGHPKMSAVAADDVRAVVPLCSEDHRAFDEGKIDLLPYLEPAWRDSQEWAAGAIGLASAVRSITGDRSVFEGAGTGVGDRPITVAPDRFVQMLTERVREFTEEIQKCKRDRNWVEAEMSAYQFAGWAGSFIEHFDHEMAGEVGS